MDNFLTKIIKKHPKPYAIIGIPVGLILGYLAITGIVHSFLGGFLGGLFLGIGITAIQHWNNIK